MLLSNHPEPKIKNSQAVKRLYCEQPETPFFVMNSTSSYSLFCFLFISKNYKNFWNIIQLGLYIEQMVQSFSLPRLIFLSVLCIVISLTKAVINLSDYLYSLGLKIPYKLRCRY